MSELLEKEVLALKRDIEWYKRTYENRRLSGIAKDRVLRFFKKKKPTSSHFDETGACIEVNTTLVTNNEAKQYLRVNGEFLQQRFSEKNLQGFTLKTPDKCNAFFEFYLETLLPIGSNIFIAGWLTNPEYSIQEMYFMFEDRTFSDNLLEDLIRFPRNDVKEHFYHKQIDVDIDCGIFGFIKNPGFKETDQIIEIHFVTKDNELVIFKCEPTHKNLTFINKVKLLLSVVNVNHPEVYKVYDQCIGPAIAEIDVTKTKQELRPYVKDYGVQPQEPLVSIIIPLYGRYDFMQYQLSLFCNDPEFKKYEIIYVVDDPSIFNAVILFSTQLYPIYQQAFKVVYSGKNLGYAGANNFGVGYANSPKLLLLNSDVIPKEKGWLSSMLSEYDSLDKCGILGPKLLFEDESIQHGGMAFEKFPFLEGFWINDHPGKGMPAWLQNNNRREVPAVTGACMLISKELYRRVGGFDEGYILGDFEDSDLCLKVYEYGFKIYYLPDVSLYHLERKSQNLFGDLSWKHKLTLYNAWRHTKRWNDLISKLTLCGNNNDQY